MKIPYLIVVLAFTASHNNTVPSEFFYDYKEGIVAAKKSNRPVFLFFTGNGCSAVLELNKLMKNDHEINEILKKKYIPIVLFVDDPSILSHQKEVIIKGRKKTLRTKGNQWIYLEITMFNCNSQPMMVILDKEENILKKPLLNKVSREEILRYLAF